MSSSVTVRSSVFLEPCGENRRSFASNRRGRERGFGKFCLEVQNFPCLHSRRSRLHFACFSRRMRQKWPYREFVPLEELSIEYIRHVYVCALQRCYKIQNYFEGASSTSCVFFVLMLTHRAKMRLGFLLSRTVKPSFGPSGGF